MHSLTARSTMRPRPPEIEHSLQRTPGLGYEPAAGSLCYLEHGYPSPLVRWHCHDEYELHLIAATSGRMFVGDHIGPFGPGQLVLVGPRLPHNWISTDCPDGGVPVRDQVILFPHRAIEHAARLMPELAEALPLLQRARHGLEFAGLAARAAAAFARIKASRGLERFAEFCALLGDLAACADVRLLSAAPVPARDEDLAPQRLNELLDHLARHCHEPLSPAALAARFAMSESRLARVIRRATGHTLTEHLNRLRINRACRLLMETPQRVTAICYEVGFNNVANFNRRFLEVKGMTPTAFRRSAEGRFGAGTAGAGDPGQLG